MRIHLVVAALITLGFTQAASAQVNPVPQPFSPYARPALSPYLNIVGGAGTNYYMLRGREEDLRNPYFRQPIVVGQDPFGSFDPMRSPGYQAVAGYQSAEDWVNQRIRETQLSPSGHPTGFLLANPYYRLPNQRSFIPYQPSSGPQMRP